MTSKTDLKRTGINPIQDRLFWAAQDGGGQKGPPP